MDWVGVTAPSRFRLRLSTAAVEKMHRLCQQSSSLETGGILVGYYEDDQATATVVDALPPPSDSARGGSWFARGVKGLGAELLRRWSSKVRTFYVGEWHYHPAQRIVASTEDFEQMAEISKGEHYQCKEPLLVILGARIVASRRDLRAWVCPVGEQALEFHEERGKGDVV